MDVQGGYMLFRGVICCSGGLYAKKIMMKIVATNVVASRPPNGDRLQRRPLVPILPSSVPVGQCQSNLELRLVLISV